MPDPRARDRRAGRGYLVPGVIALAFLAAAGAAFNFLVLTNHSPQTLAGPNVATLVAQGLQATSRSGRPPTVTCPPSEPIRAGLQFTCTAARAGRQVPVVVTEVDGRGALRWRVAAQP